MRAFAVNNGPGKPVIYVRTGNAVETLSFNTKRHADTKILALLADGYTLDTTHETVNDILLIQWRYERAGRFSAMPMDDEDE